MIHFRSTYISNQCALQTWIVANWTAWLLPPTGGAICRSNLLPEQHVCQWLVHPTRLTSPRFRVINLWGDCIAQLVPYEKISAPHLFCTPEFRLSWSNVPTWCPKCWQGMALHDWNSAVTTPKYSPNYTSPNAILLMNLSDNMMLF